VCPFLDQIDVYELVVEMAVGLGVVHAIKLLLCERIEGDDTDLDRPWRFLRLELATWIFGGIGISLWNALIYEFPHLKLMFDLQLKAFQSVEEGDYDTFVPVVSQDEFSRIAEHTNKMVGGLKERERIKSAFGKYVDVAVAESILSHETETNLGGRDAEVAVLFTDLRDFTPYAESSTPQELLAILNQYFTMVVDCVHGRNGVVDKFIGDAAMAVYGLNRCPNPCEAALQTAFSIQEGLAVLNEELTARGLTPLRIGIHCGSVVAGNIGSEERLEYTVIGDAVNIAARLESATKELTSSIAISEHGHSLLEEETRRKMVYLGDVSLKGKSEPCQVYGLPSEAA